MEKYLHKYLPELSGAVIGLLLAFCFLGLGFFKTIFIIVMIIAGLVGGHYLPLLKNLRNK